MTPEKLQVPSELMADNYEPDAEGSMQRKNKKLDMHGMFDAEDVMFILNGDAEGSMQTKNKKLDSHGVPVEALDTLVALCMLKPEAEPEINMGWSTTSQSKRDSVWEKKERDSVWEKKETVGIEEKIQILGEEEVIEEKSLDFGVEHVPHPTSMWLRPWLKPEGFGFGYPPPWEVVNLVSQYLDAHTLAVASCVNKTWSISMSSDHIWKPLCFTHYPSLSLLHSTNPTITYHQLYKQAHLSSLPHYFRPYVPRIAINELFFTFDVFDGSSHIFSFAKSGEDLYPSYHNIFRFEFDIDKPVVLTTSDKLRVRWSIVLNGWRGVFMVMDSHGKRPVVDGHLMWFNKDVPPIGCCLKPQQSKILAGLGIWLCNEGCDEKTMKIEKMAVHFLDQRGTLFWCIMSVDDALGYLQHFLLPSHLSSLPL